MPKCCLNFLVFFVNMNASPSVIMLHFFDPASVAAIMLPGFTAHFVIGKRLTFHAYKDKRMISKIAF